MQGHTSGITYACLSALIGQIGTQPTRHRRYSVESAEFRDVTLGRDIVV